jgi:hypothetical protein
MHAPVGGSGITRTDHPTDTIGDPDIGRAKDPSEGRQDNHGTIDDRTVPMDERASRIPASDG